jgi:hypothetical protein
MTKAFTPSALTSTSALAKKMDMPSKAVFELLLQKGWIERIGDHWKLTGKGQFEGGDYVNSKKYGEYIGWPESILEHHIFVELYNLPMRAGIIGKELQLSAHRFNALLAELGWQKRYHRGWVLTELGRTLGGAEQDDEETGIPYTRWPRAILDQPQLAKPLAELDAMPHKLPSAGNHSTLQDSPLNKEGNQRTLNFSSSKADNRDIYRAMDGHLLDCTQDLLIDNWLYLMGVTHAYQRSLPEAQLGYCDFYLPMAQVYLECWHASESAARLTQKLARLEFYKANNLSHIEISADDFSKLDAVLPKRLLKFGITVY